ncbi:MAG: potassium-transporting ATPase subunit C [Planctomycetaceae bacterium]|nr:potassium-transporting ATPase subunit C [Planctomycetaceae bacterium]
MNHLRSNLWLLGLTLLLCCVVYPAFLLGVGKAVFSDKAEGSLVRDPRGNPIGSRLIAQPFTGDEWFQPRPSAVGYNAAATGGSNWGSANAMLRDRVARQLGPIVKYAGGSKKGNPVGPDVEKWFHEDRFAGKAGIVAQWAGMHSGFAANWAKADPMNAAYITAWQETHAGAVAEWRKANPDAGDPKPEDLAGAFFADFSKEHPGKFPSAVERPAADGKTEKTIEPVSGGTDIQSIFFDMWRQDHADADLEPVPADMVMASGSGIDPHITLKNALYQLDRVAAKRADSSQQDKARIRGEIETLMREKSEAPLHGIAGVAMVNVLEINLALRERFEAAGRTDFSAAHTSTMAVIPGSGDNRRNVR